MSTTSVKKKVGNSFKVFTLLLNHINFICKKLCFLLYNVLNNVILGSWHSAKQYRGLNAIPQDSLNFSYRHNYTEYLLKLYNTLPINNILEENVLIRVVSIALNSYNTSLVFRTSVSYRIQMR